MRGEAQDSTSGLAGGRRRLLPPLATALAFSLFAALFCVLALMDLGRTERLLLTVLHNRAAAMVHALEKASQEKYRRLLWGGGEASFPGGPGLGGGEEELSLQETLARSLLDLARHLDLKDQENDLSAAELQRLAVAENLLGIVILAADGRISGQTGRGLTQLEVWAAPLLLGREEVSLHLFHPVDPSVGVRFIGLRRLEGKGAVFLLLGAQELQFWGWRTAIQETLREFAVSEALAYFLLETPQGQLLAQEGAIPTNTMRVCRLPASPAPGPGVMDVRCTEVGEMRVLELTAPFRWEGRTIGTARVGLKTRETDALIRENRRHIFIWTGVMIAIGLVAMVLLFSFQSRYFARLQAMQERLHQAERLSSLGKLGAGVAHEIRNPLNAISIAVQRLKREFKAADHEQQQEFQRLTQVVREEIGRLNAIVEDFLSLSRDGRLDLRPQPVEVLLRKTQSLMQEEARARGIHLQVESAAGCPPVPMDLPKMQQVLINLVKNALESITGEGSITLAAAPAGKDHLRLRVTDTGRGLASEEQQHVFDPYYTTKTKGVGLGLTIAYEIVRAHGGEISVRSAPGTGTTFEILLPLG
ncbi:MAG: ATP-binding protein [Desulfobaccales bacterium]